MFGTEEEEDLEMMDWDGKEPGALWGKCSESEDHTVPQSRDTEGATFVAHGNYRKRLRNEDATGGRRSDKHTAFHSCHLVNSSSFTVNERLTASGVEPDASPGLSNECSDQRKGFSDGKYLESAAMELNNCPTDIYDFSSVNEKHSLSSMRDSVTDFCHSSAILHNKDSLSVDGSCSFSTNSTGHLDYEPELISNEPEDKEIDNFLDCDWASFGDLDLDSIFRNNDSIDSIFGYEMVGISDGFVTPTTDVTSSTAQCFPMPDAPLCEDEPPNKGCSSYQLDEHSNGTGNELQKQKVDEQEDQLRLCKKDEERRKFEPSMSLEGSWSYKTNQNQQSLNTSLHASVTTLPQSFQSPETSQQRDPSDVESVHYPGSFNQVICTDYGYPTYPLAALPMSQLDHAERNRKGTISICSELCPDIVVSNIHSKPLHVTPQEKIDEQRVQEQALAMKAIQSQQEQHDLQITGTDSSVSQGCSQKSPDALAATKKTEEISNELPSLEQRMLIEQDESWRISMLNDGCSLKENIYYQLLHGVEKLDSRLRLCIRDSMFRLARSARERQSASDRFSTNRSKKVEGKVPADEASNNQRKPARFPASETDTNPIDRIVAQLLFHKPS